MNVFWFRRDLRLNDNAGLYHALKDGQPVIPIFIFDTNILEDLEDKDDARVEFIRNTLVEMNVQLEKSGSALHVYHGTPEKVFKEITEKFSIEKVFTNGDYEQYAIDRDNKIIELLGRKGISFHSFKDQVIFEKNEIVKDDGTPYVVFTPYSRKWKSALKDFNIKEYPVKKYFSNLYKTPEKQIPSLESIGFKKSKIEIPPKKISDSIL